MDNEQEKHEELINRLKNEGQLLRNTGTNSIKSVRTDLSKFESLFQSMNDVLIEQGKILIDILDVQKQALDVEVDAIETQRRRDALERASRTEVGSRDDLVRTSSDITPEKTKLVEASTSFVGNLFDKLGPGLSTLIGAALVGIVGLFSRRTLGRLLLKGLPIIVLAPLIGEFVGDFIEQGLKNLNLLDEEGFNESFKEGFSKFIEWPLIGFALGGWWGAKIGLFLAAGSFIWDKMNELFNLEEHMKKIADAFGLNLPDGWETAIGTAIGFAIVSIIPAIIRRALLPLLKRGAIGIAAAAAAAIGLGGARPANQPRTSFYPRTPLSRPATDNRPRTQWWRPTGGLGSVASRVLPPLLAYDMFSAGPGGQGGVEISEQLAEINPDLFGQRNAQARLDADNSGVGQIINPREGLSSLQLDDASRSAAQGIMALDIPTEEKIDRIIDVVRGQGIDISDDVIRNAIEVTMTRELIEELSNLDQSINALDETLSNLEDENPEFLRPEIEQIPQTEDSRRYSETLDMLKALNSRRIEILDLLGVDLRTFLGIEFPKFQQGTPGFLDFGAGTPAILHGMEAVVPLATPAGEFLQKAFDSNFEPNVMPSASSVISPTLERIAAAAHTAINNIVYAPTTVSPVSSITKGGSNVSSVTNNAVTSFGGGSGSGLGRFAN